MGVCSGPSRGAGGRPGARSAATPSPATSATGSVKVTSVPWPTPPLAARMRPPWASTSPLQIARPRPAAPSAPSRSPPARPVCLRNRCASRSGATPRPSSATVTATWTPSRTAATRMGEDFRGVPGGVGEQVVQHLHDAPPVGHRGRQVRRQVDRHAVPAAAAQEGVPGPLHQARDLRRFGGYRERARVDAPDIEQVADQAAHVIGLLVDDAEELAHLGRVELRSGVQRGGGRTLDRGQRRAQLVAHHAQELGPQALQLLERRQVLQGDHHRLDRAVRRTDRRRVDQRGSRSARPGPRARSPPRAPSRRCGTRRRAGARQAGSRARRLAGRS